jgi:hypothetical protein
MAAAMIMDCRMMMVVGRVFKMLHDPGESGAFSRRQCLVRLECRIRRRQLMASFGRSRLAVSMRDVAAEGGIDAGVVRVCNGDNRRERETRPSANKVLCKQPKP